MFRTRFINWYYFRSFKESGKIPFSKQKLKKKVSRSERVVEALLTKKEEIPSGPEDELFLREVIIFSTS